VVERALGFSLLRFDRRNHIARNVYAENLLIAIVDDSNRVYYYLNDHLGSAAVVIDSAGNVKDGCFSH